MNELSYVTTNDWGVESVPIYSARGVNDDVDSNYFKSKKSAEACLKDKTSYGEI
jgi:hypothetical protein